MSGRDQTDYFPIFLAGLLMGGIFVISVLIEIDITPEEMKSLDMSYADFVAIMLTSVTVIITILALFIGILAIWGYSQFQKLTETASKTHLEKMLQDGPFAKKIETTIIQHISEQLQQGELHKLLVDRVDSIILNDASLRADKEQTAPEDKPFTD